MSYTGAILILLSKLWEDQQLEVRTHPRQHQQPTTGGKLGNPHHSFWQRERNFTSLVRMLLIFKTVSLKEHRKEKIIVMNLYPKLPKDSEHHKNYTSGWRLLPFSREANCGNDANFLYLYTMKFYCLLFILEAAFLALKSLLPEFRSQCKV